MRRIILDGPLKRRELIGRVFQNEDVLVKVIGREVGIAAQNLCVERCLFVNSRLFCENVSHLHIHYSQFWAPEPRKDAIAIQLFSDTKANNFSSLALDIRGWSVAVDLTGDMEGMYMAAPTIVGNQYGIVGNFETWQPGFQVIGGHFSCVREAISLPLATQSVVRDTLIHHLPGMSSTDVVNMTRRRDNPDLRNRIKPELIPSPLKDKPGKPDWRRHGCSGLHSCGLENRLGVYCCCYRETSA